MSPAPDLRPDEFAARRKAARRTAFVVALIAVGVYVAFILSGVLGR